MRIAEMMEKLTPLECERFLGRIEGMEMSMRICRNRAEDIKDSLNRSTEAAVCAEIIRMCQVQFGSGKSRFGELTEDELAEINRIY